MTIDDCTRADLIRHATNAEINRSNFQNVLNQLQSTSAEELNESKRLSQNLSKEAERLSRKVAKYEVRCIFAYIYLTSKRFSNKFNIQNNILVTNYIIGG